MLKTVQTITTIRNPPADPMGTSRGPPLVRGPQFENRCSTTLPSPHSIATSIPQVKLLQSKGKGSPYSITARRVPELIPVLGSQPAGDVSHKPGGRLPLLTARRA